MARTPTMNVNRDGIPNCAAYVVCTVTRARRPHHVYVATDGAMRLMRDHPGKQEHRPDGERVGRYRVGIEMADVADDLSVHVAEQIGAQG